MVAIEVRINNTKIKLAMRYSAIVTGGPSTSPDDDIYAQERDNWTVEYLYNYTDRDTVSAAEEASKTASVPVEVILPNKDTYANIAKISSSVRGGDNDEALIGIISCALHGEWAYTSHQ